MQYSAGPARSAMQRPGRIRASRFLALTWRENDWGDILPAIAAACRTVCKSVIARSASQPLDTCLSRQGIQSDFGRRATAQGGCVHRSLVYGVTLSRMMPEEGCAKAGKKEKALTREICRCTCGVPPVRRTRCRAVQCSATIRKKPAYLHHAPRCRLGLAGGDIKAV